MKPQNVAFLKRAVSMATIIVVGALSGTNSLAATPASMTVYKKGSAPLAFNLSSVKNLTFGSTAVRNMRPAARVVHSIRLLPSAAGYKFTLTGEPGTSALFKMFDLKGRELFSKEFLLSGDGVGRMAVPVIAAGLFLAQLKNGASTIMQRITLGE
jgi:hypothetical protein